ncbi:hypothetical protein DPMN_088635 [Dreissena polymorpha]|uniref:Uncharacterized protein n=1 Tax=Dreissena polymorpha TaxID=45954 RepID=A0A9D4KUG0_DREPO|nr:hypothetical protein DPMN_088635 [Dreissena polymorpha]
MERIIVIYPHTSARPLPLTTHQPAPSPSPHISPPPPPQHINNPAKPASAPSTVHNE